jgi:hypothetical protein
MINLMLRIIQRFPIATRIVYNNGLDGAGIEIEKDSKNGQRKKSFIIYNPCSCWGDFRGGDCSMDQYLGARRVGGNRMVNGEW